MTEKKKKVFIPLHIIKLYYAENYGRRKVRNLFKTIILLIGSAFEGFPWIEISNFTDISDFDFTDISKKYRWIFFHKYRCNENYLKFIGMFEKTKRKNDKISNNTYFKVIL